MNRPRARSFRKPRSSGASFGDWLGNSILNDPEMKTAITYLKDTFTVRLKKLKLFTKKDVPRIQVCSLLELQKPRAAAINEYRLPSTAGANRVRVPGALLAPGSIREGLPGLGAPAHPDLSYVASADHR